MTGVRFYQRYFPIPKKLYQKSEELKLAIKSHFLFQNTEAVFIAPINDIVISMEEKKEKGADIDDDTITGIKTWLMEPMAGISDSID